MQLKGPIRVCLGEDQDEWAQNKGQVEPTEANG